MRVGSASTSTATRSDGARRPEWRRRDRRLGDAALAIARRQRRRRPSTRLRRPERRWPISELDCDGTELRRRCDCRRRLGGGVRAALDDRELARPTSTPISASMSVSWCRPSGLPGIPGIPGIPACRAALAIRTDLAAAAVRATPGRHLATPTATSAALGSLSDNDVAALKMKCADVLGNPARSTRRRSASARCSRSL